MNETSGYFDVVLIKWDQDGNQIWNTTWGFQYDEFCGDIYGDGSYIYLVGTGFDSGPVDAKGDLILVKFDVNGNVIWNHVWGGLLDDEGNGVWCNNSAIYTIGDYMAGTSGSDLVLIKWDTNGNLIWNVTWSGPYDDFGADIWCDGTGLYVAASVNDGSSVGGYLLEYSLNGIILKNNTWDYQNDEYFNALFGRGGYIYTVGETSSGPNFGYQMVIVKWGQDLQPIADFYSNVTVVSVGDTVQFTFNGSEGDAPATFQWDFGDGTPNSTAKNPIHAYSNAGQFTVRLTVTDVDGNTDTCQKNNFIFVLQDLNPVANFTSNVTTIFAGEWVQFNFTGFEGNTPVNISMGFW
ncbi:MAG: PKD domain-containing protein [Promethearchaeota archaeon]